jgi:hypothetical protein
MVRYDTFKVIVNYIKYTHFLLDKGKDGQRKVEGKWRRTEQRQISVEALSSFIE